MWMYLALGLTAISIVLALAVFYLVKEQRQLKSSLATKLPSTNIPLKEFRDKLQQLHVVSLKLSNAESLDDLFRMAVEQGRSILGFDRLGIWLADEDPNYQRGSFGTSETGELRDERGIRLPVQRENIMNKNIAEGLVWKNAAIYDDSGHTVGAGWVAAATIWDGDKVIGWISTDNYLKHAEFKQENLDLLILYGLTLGHLAKRKQAEASLAISRELTEQQHLELALASQKEKLLREFLNTVSHDLKTPLSIINTNLYLIDRNAEASQRKERLELIKTQTERLGKLIQDIITMSRLETVPELLSQAVDINEMLSAIHGEFYQEACHRQLELELDLDKNLSPIMANDEDLNRALVNLVENAIRYSLPKAKITLRSLLEDGLAVVEVRDTGMGIAEEDLPHIFERFYRADKARSKEKGGTGLGLAIVKRIIEIHQGKIEVISAVGKGSTFRVKLPQ
jgi:signal transduction histidine kinase